MARVRLDEPIRDAREIDLLGRPLGAMESERDGSLAIPLEPWQIRTFRLRSQDARNGGAPA